MLRYFLVVGLFIALLGCGDGATDATSSAASTAPAPAAAPVNEPPAMDPAYRIVANESVGPITYGITPGELRARFGDAAVEETESTVDGSLVVPGAIVFSGQPDEMEVTFFGETEGVDYNTVSVRGVGGKWHLAGTTIGIGSTIDEVQATNGGPFTIQDDGMEGSGFVEDWLGGKLSGYSLRFAKSFDEPIHLRSETDEHFYSSEDERLGGLKPTVVEIFVNLEKR